MSDIDDIEGRLAGKLDEPLPESWVPDGPGSRLIGRVRRYEKGTTQGWGDAPICVVESLRTQGRLASIWIFHTVLVNAFKKQQPKAGETILIEYRGKTQPEGGGSAYHDWKLVVDRPDGTEGLGFGEAFGTVAAPAPPVITDGAHTTHDPPVDWQTTGNADERVDFAPGEGRILDDDDIPF